MTRLYTADYETTTDPEDCRVWAWGVCEIGNTDRFYYGNNIDEFIKFLYDSDNSTFYFHNAKFDCEFLMIRLMQLGYRHVKTRKEEDTLTFSTLINDMGQFYSLKIIFKKKGKKTHYVKIYDSLKILPFSVEEVANAFGLPINKLSIDYNKYRPVGYELTQNEIDYLYHDVKIMALALKVLFDQGLTKMTQASNALHDYKQTVGDINFNRWFPVPDYDKDVRQAYKGGFTYLNPKYRDKDIKTGLTLDVNSLYPSVLYYEKLPYDDGVFFKGQYKEDKLYDLYVQMFSCYFQLKEGYIPTIQLKNNLRFIPTQYLESSDGEYVTLCLSNVDLELFLKHYDVTDIEYHSGWKFKSTRGLFKNYIDKWVKVKNESTLNGNKAMRTLAKLMLNALYGRFSTSSRAKSKYPVYEDGKLTYIDGEEESKSPLYIPVGIFVTAYARRKTIESAQKIYDKFIYADTDSLSIDIDIPPEMLKMSNKELSMLTTEDVKKFNIKELDALDIDPVALGSWKIENFWFRARFIRQKCYIKDMNTPETWETEEYDKDLFKITCAGMPTSCYPYVTWDNFHSGAKYAGKLVPKHVKGGIVLMETEYTILRSN